MNDTLDDIITDFENEHDGIASVAREELASLRRIKNTAQEWMQEYTPSCKESFYQMDSVILALPELGIAIFKALNAGRKVPS